MYHKKQIHVTKFRVNKAVEGETIEAKVRRIVRNKESIDDGADLIYQDRKDGVDPAHDIRTDRFELAAAAMDKVTADTLAKRDGAGKEAAKPEASKDTSKGGKDTTGSDGADTKK